MTISYQSAAVRRSNARTHFGFEATEIAHSAICEASAQVAMTDVFPSSDIPDLQAFFTSVATDDMGSLNSKYAGYKAVGRIVRDGSGNPLPQQLFVAFTWPEAKRPAPSNGFKGFLQQYDATQTLTNCKNVYGFKSLSKVSMSVLGWRRDFAGVQWQDWGVLHYSCTVVFDDGNGVVTRTLHQDRLFAVYAHTVQDGKDVPPDPGEDATFAAYAASGNNNTTTDASHIFLHFIKSQRSLRTVIQRS